MFDDEKLLAWQREQYTHDMRNHFDILSLHKQDRLKHYAMHMAKYAARVMKGPEEPKPLPRTLVDALLVSLSSANTLHQKLCHNARSSNRDLVYRLTVGSGMMCDAAEKVDHLEPFIDIAREGNQMIFDAVLDAIIEENLDPDEMLAHRRGELKEKQFFIEG